MSDCSLSVGRGTNNSSQQIDTMLLTISKEQKKTLLHANVLAVELEV
jgi:hypothetical protein